MTPTEIRLKLLAQGYQPIPTAGKVPCCRTGPSAVRRQPATSRCGPDSTRTPIPAFCVATVPCLDIDIEDADAANAVEAVVPNGSRSAARSAFASVALLAARSSSRRQTPFKHAERKFAAPNGDTKQKVEMLADGRQVIVHGIHDRHQ